ncbi:beta-lactamase [Marmoricola endophyticus]|uniref:Beta-lactamase n=1 Tax=Marmoricola endophyticus TaxID=2040280 RepID=A0A917BKN6_9ACTN|nr:class A beta-lactamase [Marmoricola endophyticus]GGF47014.1 beta-lactamase [Marmoricola endophyticus]
MTPAGPIAPWPVSRRLVLATGVGTVLAGCAPSPSPSGTVSSSSSPSSTERVARAQAELADLERELGGRLGVHAVSTATGVVVGHRADERFLMCSTHKVLAVAAVLRLAEQRPGLLGRRIRYDRTQLLDHAPVTSQHVDEGMDVAALCEAAITLSDNTAANLLVDLVGGPAKVTEFVRTLGDPVTRLDRTEPDVNVGAPGDQRDTTTAAHMGANLRALALGSGLHPASRRRIVGWLRASTTGARSIRAGLPDDWEVGDKTGSGAHGEVNDVAVVWPPRHPPLVVAVYTAPSDPDSTSGYETVAAAYRIVSRALAPTA